VPERHLGSPRAAAPGAAPGGGWGKRLGTKKSGVWGPRRKTLGPSRPSAREHAQCPSNAPGTGWSLAGVEQWPNNLPQQYPQHKGELSGHCSNSDSKESLFKNI
jgi:hypothetical protein